MLPTKFRHIWQSGFGGEDLNKSANQKQELPVMAMFVNGSDGSNNTSHNMAYLYEACDQISDFCHQ
jgi:hypothetical protein